MSITPTDKNQQPLALYKFRFTPKTPNIATGAEVVIPDWLSVIYGAFIVTDEAWDGTTPHADFGFSESGDQTVFTTLGSGAVSLASASTGYGGATEASAAVTSKPLVVAAEQFDPETGLPTPAQTKTALYVCVNQTGAPNGAASNSTVGSSTLYLVMGDAIDLNVQADQPQIQ
jgi:hypothetical protein